MKVVRTVMNLKNVNELLLHFRKKHGDMNLHVLPTVNGVGLLVLGQNSVTPNMKVNLLGATGMLLHKALLSLRNPTVKVKVDNGNVGDVLGVTLLPNVVCTGVLL